MKKTLSAKNRSLCYVKTKLTQYNDALELYGQYIDKLLFEQALLM